MGAWRYWVDQMWVVGFPEGERERKEQRDFFGWKLPRCDEGHECTHRRSWTKSKQDKTQTHIGHITNCLEPETDSVLKAEMTCHIQGIHQDFIRFLHRNLRGQRQQVGVFKELKEKVWSTRNPVAWKTPSKVREKLRYSWIIKCGGNFLLLDLYYKKC
jgi:hypothetical protein